MIKNVHVLLALLFAFQVTGCADLDTRAAERNELDDISERSQSLAILTLPTQLVDRFGDGWWRKGEGALIAKRAMSGLGADGYDDVAQRCAEVVELPLEAPEGQPSWYNILRGSVVVVSVTQLKNRFEDAYPDTEFLWPENEQGGVIPRRLRDLLLGLAQGR